MSQYKAPIRSQPPSELPENSKYRSQVRQLQELFPNWSNDDLQSALVEAGGDVALTATRITDGVAVPWDSVSRKKDKKNLSSSQSTKDSYFARNEPRGARGGRRGGRGGPGRGGATTRGRGGSARGGVANGYASRSDSPRPPSTAPVNGTVSDWATSGGTHDSSATPASTEPHEEHQNGIIPSTSNWTDSSTSQGFDASSSAATTLSAWSTTGVPSGHSGDTEPNGPSSLNVNAHTGKQASKPATSKMTWAQIARPQEKIASPIPIPAPSAPPIPSAPPAPSPLISVANVTETENQEPVQRGWEDPTTVQAPTWDDEPTTKLSTTTVSDSWPPTAEPASTEQAEPETTAKADVNNETTEEPAPAPEPMVEQPKSEIEPQQPPPTPAAILPHTTVTPSPKLSGRPAAVSHRNSARHKLTTDQPVVMPSSFGSIEKVGMQFGSLRLDSESFETESEVPPATVAQPEVTSLPPALASKQESASAPPATAPASSASLSSVFSQQQSLPQQPAPQSTTVQPSATHHSVPTSVSQPSQTPTTHAAVATSPIQQFTQQQQQQQQTSSQQPLSINNSHHQPQQQHQPQFQQQQHPQQSHQSQHPQSHSNHSYSQLGLPTHIDPAQQVQTPTHQQQLAAHSTYFRQSEPTASAPYFHTPTPPAGQTQESPYGAFGQLAGQGQQQASHLGGFGSADYGYGDNQRGFYESYAQQSAFGNRNVLGHDDVKGIPGAQQQTSTAGIPPSSAQTSQQHVSSQAPGQPQPGGGQGPQQGYPPPLPFYYTHAYPQNQFYSQPYSGGYGVPQPAYMKYAPNVFPPAGPPGPGSAPSPATKQPGTGVGVTVQPQSNPYSQGLYQQGGYDDYQPHAHHAHQPQHQQHTQHLGLGQAGVGVGSGDYGKQLYGGAGQGGIQGFMGLGGQSGGAGANAGTSAGGPRGAGSPETTYKSYAPKDTGIGVAGGRGGSVQQGQQGQSQGQNQSQGGQGGPPGQFYGANRFSGAGTTGVGGIAAGMGGPQQNAHHQQGGPQGHLGYPQGGSDGNGFYSYQPRQQQGYWQ